MPGEARSRIGFETIRFRLPDKVGVVSILFEDDHAIPVLEEDRDRSRLQDPDTVVKQDPLAVPLEPRFLQR